MNECNAAVAQTARTQGQLVLNAIDGDLTIIAEIESGQNLDQGRLATSIGSQEAVNLTGSDVKVDAAKGGYSRKGLFQARNFKELSPGGRAFRASTGSRAVGS